MAKNSIYEKPKSEMPATCGECEHYDKGNWCMANGCACVTYSFSDPSDRPLPIPLNCYWWYANDFGSSTKKASYYEQRLHLFTLKEAEREKEITSNEFREIYGFMNRRGGCGMIDFEKYPQLLPAYQRVLEKDGIKEEQNAESQN